MEKLKERLDLSEITLGTMRFAEKGLARSEVAALIEACFDAGITTHHSSHEYNSYDLYRGALADLNCRAKLKHIVKLSSPHFDESCFSAKILTKRVDQQLSTLDIDCIDVLQWLVRSQPINDEDRLQMLTEQSGEISDCFADLKADGKIKSVFSFPYSMPFAQPVCQLDQIDGIISYLNLHETDYASLANSTPFIGIRSLAAGELAKSQEDIARAIDFVKSHSGVLTQVISINRTRQITNCC